MSIRLVVTAGLGNGTFNGTIKDVVLRGYSIGVSSVIAGGVYNAAEFFTSGQGDVVITLYDQELAGASVVSLTSSVCVEVGSTGLYMWDMTKITTLPTPRKEYGYIMTDGATSEGGIITYDEFLIQYIIHENMEI